MFHYTQVFGKQFWEELFVRMKLCTIFAECLNCIIFNTTNLGLQRRYLSTDDAYFFRVCDENEKNIMRRKYLDILKKSGFRELCITYADLCKSENVDVQCWSLRVPTFPYIMKGKTDIAYLCKQQLWREFQQQ